MAHLTNKPGPSGDAVDSKKHHTLQIVVGYQYTRVMQGFLYQYHQLW